MGDPELRSDENVLLRTHGVYVKSIPFEGVLTNKRIILIDRAKDLLPQKEIPLVTIKDIEPGENAIRDQIIKLSVLARSGETRQMILTFSRQAGGNRIKERDEWLKVLKENTSSSFEQVIHKVIPGSGPAPKKSIQTASPRIEVINTPVSQNVPPAAKTIVKKDTAPVPPIKKIIESRPDPAPTSIISEESGASVPSFGTYCSRCGNRVPEGSGFCNRCGSQIVLPGSMPASTPPPAAIHQPADPETVARKIKPIDKEIRSILRSQPPAVTVPPDPPREVPREPVNEPEKLTEKETAWPEYDVTILDSDEKPEQAAKVSTPSQNSESILPAGEPPVPKEPLGGFNYILSKKAVISIIIAIIIVAVVVGAFFLYPVISDNEGATAGNDSALTSILAIFNNTGITVIHSNATAPGNSSSNDGQ